MSVFVGTWSFAKYALDVAAQSYANDPSHSVLDAIETGVNVIECDDKFGPCIVGRGGPRNKAGYLEIDAAVMRGRDLNFGAVTSLKGVAAAISVARKIMDDSIHSLITGDGALEFAREKGFHIEPDLLASNLAEADMGMDQTHDTLGVLGRGENGDLYAGVSSSGMPGKHPGRVGDSALPGCGLYADDEAGCACCSGDGDELMKFCPSIRVVDMMRTGVSPNEACEQMVRTISQKCQKKGIEVAILALNDKGDIGAATTITKWTDPISQVQYDGFPYAVWRSGMVTTEMRTCQALLL